MRLLPSGVGAGLSLEDVRRSLARRSLTHFVQQAWDAVEPDTKLEWNWHLTAICDHVQALLEGRLQYQNLGINVPPGSMKSLIVSVFAPAWWWLDHPWWRAIFASANPRVTIRDSIRCRDLIEHDWYRSTFNPNWSLAGDQNAKGLYKTTRGGFRMAVSASAKVVGERAHALFMDDLLDATDAKSTTKGAREEVNYWYDMAFANRLADPRTGIRCMISQRLHEDDPAGHVYKNGDWEVLSIPEAYVPPKDGVKPVTSIGWSDPRTLKGELLFPVRRNAAFLWGEKVRLGSQMFEAQHQQRPTPDAGIVFQRDWLQRRFTMPQGWEGMPVAELCAKLGIKRICIGWDTALGDGQENDYTAWTVIGDTGSRYLVLAHGFRRMTAPETKRDVMAKFDRWKPYAVPIEGKGSAGGKAVVQMLREDTTVPCIEVPNIDKVMRAGKVAPTVEFSIWFPNGEPWVDGLIESLCRFPRGQHDDDVDSFTITVEHLVFGETTTGLLDWYEQQAKLKAGGG